MRRLAVLLGAAVVLTGCANINSQISTLEAGRGRRDHRSEHRRQRCVAGKGQQVLVAPVCEYTAEVYTCDGTTIDGDKIRAEADGAKPTDFTVDVGGKQIFSGGIQDVLTKAGQR